MSRRLLYLSLFVAGLLLAFACGDSGGGSDTGGGDTTTTKVAEVSADGFVRCLSASVEAGEPSSLSSVVPCSETASITNLDTGDQVAVDAGGEAAVAVGGCGPVYVFESSGLKLSSCRKAKAGNIACTTVGTVGATSQGCPVEIQTDSASVTTNGTWFTVTYDERLGTTLVTVFDGEVEVTPFADLGDIDSGFESATVTAGEFYYTMPNEQLMALGAVEPRVAQPLVAVTPVIQDLRATPQFDSAKLRAATDDVDPGILLNVNALVLRTGGGFFDEGGDAGAQIMASALQWDEIFEPNREGGVVLPLSGEGSRVFSGADFDPDGAAALLDEIGGFGQPVSIVIVETDEETVGRALFVRDGLEQFGIEIGEQISVGTADDGLAILAEFAEAGIPTVMIGG